MKYFKGKLPELVLSYKTGEEKRFNISGSKDAYVGLKELYDIGLIEYCESAIVLYLNRANNTLGWKMISQGGISGTIIDVRIIYATALQCGASAIILSHNHPSGRLAPSDADKAITKKVKEAGKLFDIAVLDHLIITKDNYFSFADEGIL
jgi:DNA repair protein RadC